MQEKVMKLWGGKKAKEYTFTGRETLSTKTEMTRVIHSYGRSQCRTTHKRKDC